MATILLVIFFSIETLYYYYYTTLQLQMIVHSIFIFPNTSVPCGILIQYPVWNGVNYRLGGLGSLMKNWCSFCVNYIRPHMIEVCNFTVRKAHLYLQHSSLFIKSNKGSHCFWIVVSSSLKMFHVTQSVSFPLPAMTL